MDARAQAQPQLGGRLVGEERKEQRRRRVVHHGRRVGQPAAGHVRIPNWQEEVEMQRE